LPEQIIKRYYLLEEQFLEQRETSMATGLNKKLAMAREQVREAYRNGATLRQIGEVHDVSPGTVRNVLMEMGETLRPRGRRKKADTYDPRILPATPSIDGEQTTTRYEGGSF
jgi:hypothetical protein